MVKKIAVSISDPASEAEDGRAPPGSAAQPVKHGYVQQLGRQERRSRRRSRCGPGGRM